MEEKIIWYLCDGEKENCKKTYCYKNTEENPCRYTKDINHAMNFRKETHGKYEIYVESDCEKTIQPEHIQRKKDETISMAASCK